MMRQGYKWRMPCLAIQTATANRWHAASLALRLPDGETLTHRFDEPHSQAAQLIPAMEALLQQTGIWYGDLRSLIITIGPGSFTGIRIGLAAARMIAFANPALRLIPISTLEAIAARHPLPIPAQGIEVRSMAGKGEVYVQHFAPDAASGKLVATSPITLQPQAHEQDGFGELWAHELLDAESRVQLQPHEAAPLYVRAPDAALPQRAGAL
jgi:tRNA threonylcarbamoyladenosine biosynthesis protein TsaB